MLSVIAGLVALALGIWLLAWNWWDYFVAVLFGSLPVILIFGGLIAMIAGISSIKDKIAEKKEAKQESSSETPKEEKSE